MNTGDTASLAPDLQQPIAGCRLWRVATTLHAELGGLLWGVGRWVPEDGWFVAQCPNQPDNPDHVPPGKDCGCGFYAHHTPMELLTLGGGFGGNGAVGGVVSARGDVELSESGWRAQYARVEGIFDHPSLPTDGLPYSRQYIADKYGAELIAPHEFEDLCIARGLAIITPEYLDFLDSLD